MYISASVSPPAAMPRAAAVSIALAGALLGGVLTSYGQAGPDFVATLANSAGPWFLAAVLLLAVARVPLAWAMPLGVVLLELLHVGYWAATNLRGHPDSLSITNTWVLLAIPAGVLAGAVVSLVRGHGERARGIAIGVVAALLAGEGIRALLTVAATTSVAFWIAEIIAAGGLVVVGLAVARTPIARIATLGTGLVGSLVVLAAYLAIGG